MKNPKNTTLKKYLKTRPGAISKGMSGMSVLKVFYVANELARMLSLNLNYRAPKA